MEIENIEELERWMKWLEKEIKHKLGIGIKFT